MFSPALWLASLLAFLAPEAGPPLRVLFLGDRGHHQPADRAEQLIPVMAGRGIAVEYTEDVSALNPERLAKYDALLLYANIDAITPEQEKALLDYVSNGGGFAPIHCASYCFRNSEAFVALVGAQFEKHGTGEFETKVVAPEHPIMAGLIPFATWDETYAHTKHHPEGRTVLQTRPDPAGDEPWTWAREHGKGRVFYTAYGHDHRTWGQPGFHDLIERGLRWAAHKGDVYDSRPSVPKDAKPLAYEAPKGKIPNYLPGQSWGTLGKPIDSMQRPLAPADSARHVVAPKGFAAELVVAEPDVTKPIALNWDHRGRLWVAESLDYPNVKHPGEGGRDRLKVCEDTDGDGRPDKFTVFAEGLNVPTSFTFADGGVIVAQAPDFLFLKDTDGDGKADMKKVLFTGWGSDDTHAGPSNLRYGLDNQIWGIVGYAAFDGNVGGERHSFRQGIYRFAPDGSKLEFLRSTNNNSWGLGFSEEGLVFASTANGCPSVYLPIPNRIYESVRGGSARVLANIADSNRFFPITPNVRQVDFHGGFTAAAGHALYTARAYPEHYWNRTAFVAEPTGHLVATFSLHPRGADFASHNAWNLVAGDDEWFAPIAAEVGPDGNVWVLDWYNYIVQHNPTPQGFTTGKGNAYETPLRDQSHGRIYRVVWKGDGGKPTGDSSPLDPNDGKGLVAALKRDNQFWRMHAQRLLVERGKPDVIPDLLAMAAEPDADAIGLNVGAIHALATLRGLKALDDPAGPARSAVVGALKHRSAGVRRVAIESLPRDEASTTAILASGILKDADAQVRLAGLIVLAESPASEDAGKAIAQAVVDGIAQGDPWLADAAVAAAARNDRAFLAALVGQGGEISPAALGVAAKVAEHYARGRPAETIGGLLAGLAASKSNAVGAILEGIAKGWPRDAAPKLEGDAAKALRALLVALPPESKGTLVALASRWSVQGFEEQARAYAGELLALAADDAKPERERAVAARQAIELRRDDPEAVATLMQAITPRTPADLAASWLDAASRSEAKGSGTAVLDALPALTPTLRSQALRALMGRSEWTAALVEAIGAGKVRLTDLALDQRQALAAHPDAAIAAKAKALMDQGGGLPDPDRQKVIESLGPLVLKGGEPARGHEIFRQQCAKCHKHGEEGGQVGPDLSGMAAHPREELLVHILDPSRSVEGNFVQYTLLRDDGRVLNGLLASETKTAVELLDAEGKSHSVPRDEIEQLAASSKSLMPEGFEKQVPAEGLADLLAFLTQRGKYLPLDLHKTATIASTQGMFYSKDAQAERLIFPDWAPKTFQGIPFSLVDPQGGRVPNVVMLNGPQGAFPPRMPKAVELPCHTPAKAIHLLSGVSGWGYAGGTPSESVSMIVRLRYADGTTEDHPLKDGVHFADYIRVVDVPGSALAFRLRGQQVRYLSIAPKKAEIIDRIEFVKGDDATAPVVVAVTVEVGG